MRSSHCILWQSLCSSQLGHLAPPNIAVIYTAFHKVSQKVASQYWPNNYCCMWTLPMPSTGLTNLLNPYNRLSACLLESGWSSRSVHPSVGDRLNSSAIRYPWPPGSSAKIWKWTGHLCRIQYWLVPRAIWLSIWHSTWQAWQLTTWYWMEESAPSWSICRRSPIHCYIPSMSLADPQQSPWSRAPIFTLESITTTTVLLASNALLWHAGMSNI